MNLRGSITALKSNEQDGEHLPANLSIMVIAGYHQAGYNTNASKIYKILSLLQLCHYLYFPAKVGIKSCRILLYVHVVFVLYPAMMVD